MDEELSSSELHAGPVRNPNLPGGFVERTFKKILGDADSVSLEKKTIDAFTRDAHPEAEASPLGTHPQRLIEIHGGGTPLGGLGGA